MATSPTVHLADLTALEGYDADGALRETLAATKATTNDVSILNFALTLEYLETAFYEEAVRKGALKGETLKYAKIARNHERGHVTLLEDALGSAAIRKPKVDFKRTTENARTFRATAIVLEDTGVQAYAGQAGLLDDAAILTTAVRIHSIEARHAAWIRHIVGKEPAPRAFDTPLTTAQVLAAVKKTGFIVG
jgi:rubrerythrin